LVILTHHISKELTHTNRNLRKVKILLNAIDKAGKHDVQYYALDLSKTELERTLAAVPRGTFEGVQCYGLFGTYDDGLEWLKRPEIRSKAKTVLSLGSSIGNFSRTEAAEFLHSFSQALDGPHDALLIGLDGCKDHDRVWHAYNDKEGVTKRFYQGGLLHANAILGYDAFKLDQWDIIGIYNEAEGRHEAFIKPLVDVTIEGALCQQGERIRIEDATKYSETEAKRLWRQAGLMETHKWSNAGVKYGTSLLITPRCIANPPTIGRSRIMRFEICHMLVLAGRSLTAMCCPSDMHRKQHYIIPTDTSSHYSNPYVAKAQYLRLPRRASRLCTQARTHARRMGGHLGIMGHSH
jgi:EasF-like predicted methyltransferase